MRISVVIPAHDEEVVVGRCLAALFAGARDDELDVIVVCNGCRYGTAAAPGRGAPRPRVLEVPVASKTEALNAGDAAARFFPRFYVDADVVLSLESVRRIAARLDAGALAAAPTMDVDLSRASRSVRAFYGAWTRLPYTREGMIGVGAFALSEAGRRRFDRFPDVVADDGFVRAHFAPGERVRVEDAKVVVTPPSTLADLLRVKARSRLGGYELARRYPELAARERRAKDYAGAWRALAGDPRRWPQSAFYVAVNTWTRILARRRLAGRTARSYSWDRDASSRRAPQS